MNDPARKDPAISRFPVPELQDLPDDIRQRIEKVQEKAGFIPNIFLALAHRPDEFRAFFAYHDALMDKPGGLSQAEREMIVVATSSLNDCLYCVIAHGAILRIRAKNHKLAEQISCNYRRADITPRQRTLLDFAVKVAARSRDIADEDLKILADQGFSQDEIWDAGAIAALFALSNRLANLAALQPNAEFYRLGRE